MLEGVTLIYFYSILERKGMNKIDLCVEIHLLVL